MTEEIPTSEAQLIHEVFSNQSHYQNELSIILSMLAGKNVAKSQLESEKLEKAVSDSDPNHSRQIMEYMQSDLFPPQELVGNLHIPSKPYSVYVVPQNKWSDHFPTRAKGVSALNSDNTHLIFIPEKTFLSLTEQINATDDDVSFYKTYNDLDVRRRQASNPKIFTNITQLSNGENIFLNDGANTARFQQLRPTLEKYYASRAARRILTHEWMHTQVQFIPEAFKPFGNFFTELPSIFIAGGEQSYSILFDYLDILCAGKLENVLIESIESDTPKPLFNLISNEFGVDNLWELLSYVPGSYRKAIESTDGEQIPFESAKFVELLAHFYMQTRKTAVFFNYLTTHEAIQKVERIRNKATMAGGDKIFPEDFIKLFD